jgi:molybdopterin-guanine dinucleotide biosynthesis protein A
VCDRLATTCGGIVVVAGHAQTLPPLSSTRPLDIVSDRVRFQGPLQALAAGLRATTTDLAIVAAVDSPLISVSLLDLLLTLTPGHDAVVPRVGGRLQPLLAVYRVDPALVAAERTLAAGRRAVHDLFELLPPLVIPEGELRVVDPDLLSFRNTNTPLELAALERSLVR